jgi:3'(2'), 5'-bisphosphate nucleotidase
LPVLSGEDRDIEFQKRRYWEYFWLSDPLDGTKEFIAQNGEFTVNIALIKRATPVAGVIFASSLNILYSGVEGNRSKKN